MRPYQLVFSAVVVGLMAVYIGMGYNSQVTVVYETLRLVVGLMAT